MNDEQLNALQLIISFMNDTGLDIQPLDSLAEAVNVLEQFSDNCITLDEGDDSLATDKHIYPFPKVSSH
jgi:hypothetical protein